MMKERLMILYAMAVREYFVNSVLDYCEPAWFYRDYDGNDPTTGEHYKSRMENMKEIFDLCVKNGISRFDLWSIRTHVREDCKKHNKILFESEWINSDYLKSFFTV